MYSPKVSKKQIERLKTVFRLQDWTITCKISRKKTSDCFGEVYVELPYRRAEIILYKSMITKASGESSFSILVHEFCEIVMAEHIGVFHPTARNTAIMLEYRDHCADHMSRIVLDLLKQLG